MGISALVITSLSMLSLAVWVYYLEPSDSPFDRGIDPYHNMSARYHPTPLYYEHQDSEGIIVFPYEGRDHYHPVQMAQRTILLLEIYNETGNASALETAIRTGEKMMEVAHDFNGALFFPYTFNYTLHGNRERMTAPWYSGMAQGQALSAFTRLYSWTGDDSFLDAAERTFQSFTARKGNDTPWVVSVDTNQTWIEEYPVEGNDTHVLNGFIFATFGLYDHYCLTKDSECLELILSCMDTILSNVNRYRVPGSCSYYCLGHELPNKSYHQVHVHQLEMLGLIARNPTFHELAILFDMDFTPE